MSDIEKALNTIPEPVAAAKEKEAEPQKEYTINQMAEMFGRPPEYLRDMCRMKRIKSNKKGMKGNCLRIQASTSLVRASPAICEVSWGFLKRAGQNGNCPAQRDTSHHT